MSDDFEEDVLEGEVEILPMDSFSNERVETKVSPKLEIREPTPKREDGGVFLKRPQTPRSRDSIKREMEKGKKLSDVVQFPYEEKLFTKEVVVEVPPEKVVEKLNTPVKIVIGGEEVKHLTPLVAPVQAEVVEKKLNQEVADFIKATQTRRLSQNVGDFIAKTKELNIPPRNFGGLPEIEKRQELKLRVRDVQNKHPNMVELPENFDTLPLVQAERMVGRIEGYCNKGNRTVYLKIYLVIGVFLLEKFGGTIINMEGLWLNQLKMVGNYEHILADLVDTEPALTAANWSPWMKLLFILIANMVVFVGAKKYTDNPEMVEKIQGAFANMQKQGLPEVQQGQQGGGDLMSMFSSFAPMLGGLFGGNKATTAKPSATPSEAPSEEMARPKTKWAKKKN